MFLYRKITIATSLLFILLAENGPRIEKYLKYNYKGIESVTFNQVDINPTGVPRITGYVNNNPKMEFDAGIYNEQFEGDIIISNLIETDSNFQYGAKNVSDIEKEETKQK